MKILEQIDIHLYVCVSACVPFIFISFSFFFSFFASFFNMAYACLFVVGDENRVHVYKSMRVRTCVSFKIGRYNVLAYTQEI